MAQGPVLALSEGISFWGGVDPSTARIIDAHHPAYGADMTGKIVMMPTSRGSCSGSGVILEMLLNGNGPAALIFSEAEDVATLGALIGGQMFGKTLPVLRFGPDSFARCRGSTDLSIEQDVITGDGFELPISELPAPDPQLSDTDLAALNGDHGPAAAIAMRIIQRIARLQGAERLTDISHGHIDGCILANQANLIFAEKMDQLGARVRVPTTINAISVDRRNWQEQGVPPLFGDQASRLADAYVRMGCKPSFTCAPYLLDDRPALAQDIAWAESNAVIYANSVLGARTPKHPDYLDLCIAVTGRAPLAGVYTEDARRPASVLIFDPPADADESIWPLIGYVAGQKSPDRVPLLCGLERLNPSRDDLKALCAAFGTTSAAPMLHVAGVTPEAELPIHADARHLHVANTDLARAWGDLNRGEEQIDLIGIGSPHSSAAECRRLLDLLGGRETSVPIIITAGRQIIAELEEDGTLAALTNAGVQVFPDLCWCSITEPLLPVDARTLMTNSGKFAHYGPGLFKRALRFGSLGDCASAAIHGTASLRPPAWLAPENA
ncbi:cis-3-hydroxy-L-proline dehydratase [Paracoccus onchidii]|uniref:cis-3-hydroxy-L-proline dehydratase n=1 Tax=Paracoccus onchidii TaxID=3017813 RepID=UPI002FE438A1